MHLAKDMNDAVLQDVGPRHVLFDVRDQEVTPEFMRQCLAAASEAREFDQSLDPFGEHEGGRLRVLGERIFFRIIHFDRSMQRRRALDADVEETISVLVFYN